ncbi:GNAT family N-acetyltransferase [Undibacterium sp. CY18W]|uniref:GNAT family N-acetyltransferase n=1 Tax=Undibacterium hunanense TaxID=2762292 RepID=A0ABR6ZLR1_9BURK|nr:GNAT family N-acetyltransferase [Undibacterium hunanense]MBC3916827.1 GNAT family N-acetyltransferase [Undibacterium hunanense]
MSLQVRSMLPQDLAAVFDIQSLAYVSDMVETLPLLAARLQSAPDTAWVAEQDGCIMAYLAAYPSIGGRVSALGQAFSPASTPNALYLHDLAVDPAQAGKGVAQAMIAHAFAYAQRQNWQYICLVSVQSTSAFWQRLGFVVQAELDQQQTDKLASYSGAAFYMIKDLRAGV